MPYGTFKRGTDEKPYCVYKVDAEDQPVGETLGCHTSKEAAAAQIQAIGASAHARSALWLSLAEMEELCPSCAESMRALSLSAVNLAAMKQMPEALLEGLCSKVGSDPGFFTKCQGMDFGEFDLRDKDAFCAWLHEQCTGKFPGEQRSVGDHLKAELGVANVGGLLEGKVHEQFTVVADQLFQAGILTRDERKALSSAIGKSLDKLDKAIEDLQLFDRVLSDGYLGGVIRGVKMAELDTDSMVNWGGPLKALGDGRVGGYLIMFSKDETEADLVGDWFWPGTRLLWSPNEKRPAIYHHGLDPKMGKTLLGNSWSQIKVDEVGLWVETQLKMRDEYEAAIYKLATRPDKKMGLSSGTANHMIDKRPDGRIDLWPVVEGSFTPTPAEPRTSIASIKSIQPYSLKTLIDGLGGDALERTTARRRIALRSSSGTSRESVRGSTARVLNIAKRIRQRRKRR